MGFVNIQAIIAAMTVAVPATTDPTVTVRAFLEAFASDPEATKGMVTSDAMIAVGDIGAPYAEFLSGVGREVRWFASCRVASIRSAPGREPAQVSDLDGTPWLKGGQLALVEGTYACTGPTGSKIELHVGVILKDGRVAQFVMDAKR